MKIEPKITDIRSHSSNNEIEILKSKTCSCLFCRQTYDARKVNDWVSDERGVSALCPECGMDAVIGDASGIPLDKTTLKEANLAYFGEDYMERHPLAAKKFVERYKEGKITHKSQNEALFIQYLFLLASKGDADAAYDLGEVYEFGTDFTQADSKTAFSYYGMECLRKDGDALTRLGVLSESGVLGKVDPQGAYECYSKAMAMGSLNGLIRFVDCYRHGVFVLKDESFAFQCLSEIWPEAYSRFVTSSGKDINIFPDCSYRLGIMLMEGEGTKKDLVMALRLFLYAELGYGLLRNTSLLKGELLSESADTLARIAIIAKHYRLQKQDPVFDNDTFADSMEIETGDIKNLPEKYSFSPSSYDKDGHHFEFDVTYSYPPLIVDCGNLFCGFVPETIHWSFEDVSDVKLTQESLFDKVNGNPEDGWQFVRGEAGSQEVVASIVFVRSAKKRNGSHKATNGNKA